MVFVTVNWATIASLATAVGTLGIGSGHVRGGAILQPVGADRRGSVAGTTTTSPGPLPAEDPTQKIMFLEGNWVSASGGRAAVEHIDGAVYLAISLRNVGSGIAVCQGWTLRPGCGLTGQLPMHAPLEEFRLQSRDLYIPAGDIGMWQGALRNPDDQVRAATVDAIETGETITVEVLYSDQVGLQRTISRFGLVPTGDSWLASLNRHWYLDWDGPRPEDLALAAAEVILRDREAAVQRQAAADDADADPDAEAGDTVGATSYRTGGSVKSPVGGRAP